MGEFASKGVAGAGLGLGIAGTTLGVLNGMGGNLLGGMWGRSAACSDDCVVNRYELGLTQEIAAKDAEKYAKEALKYQTDDKSLSDVYITLANQELDHMDKLHNQVLSIIRAYKSTNGDPPSAMQKVWDWEHEQMMGEVARIKTLISSLKS